MRRPWSSHVVRTQGAACRAPTPLPCAMTHIRVVHNRVMTHPFSFAAPSLARANAHKSPKKKHPHNPPGLAQPLI